MQKQDFFAKQQNKNGFSGGVIRHAQPKTHGNKIRAILLLAAIVLVGVGYFYKNQLFTQKLPTPVLETGYTIGTEIQEEGILSADGDLFNFSHTLKTQSGQLFLLKSKTIALNNYSSALSWVFQIIGTVESFYQGLPLVEVSAIGTQTTTENSLGSWSELPQESTNPGVYVSKAGLGFPAEFFDNYAFVGEAWTNGEISVKNLDNEKVTKIKFFSCTDSWDNNCKELTRTFGDTAAKKVTTLNGDTFFKLPEINSWYFQNGNWRGYFINDAEEAEVESIRNQILIPNAEIIKDIVSRYGIRTCLGNNEGTSSITTHQVQKTSEWLKLTMEWSGEKSFTCEALLDLSQPTQLKFIDIKIKETAASQTWAQEKKPETKNETNDSPTLNTSENETKTAQTSGNLPITPASKQFPINIEKALTYTSSRGGYKMLLPSSNISYSSDGADEDFGQAGVRCSYATRVIQYKDKDNLQSNPSVIVYECSTKKELQLPWENYFIKELWDKKFVIGVLDPAWFDFAKNISIESL